MPQLGADSATNSPSCPCCVCGAARMAQPAAGLIASYMLGLVCVLRVQLGVHGSASGWPHHELHAHSGARAECATRCAWLSQRLASWRVTCSLSCACCVCSSVCMAQPVAGLMASYLLALVHVLCVRRGACGAASGWPHRELHARSRVRAACAARCTCSLWGTRCVCGAVCVAQPVAGLMASHMLALVQYLGQS